MGPGTAAFGMRFTKLKTSKLAAMKDVVGDDVVHAFQTAH